MRTSASSPAGARAQSGFTLLEIMVTLAVVAVVVVPLLQQRQAATNTAYRAGHDLAALRYAQDLLAHWSTDPETFEERSGIVEEDPVYRWTLTVEPFDLSTGRPVEEDEFGLFGDTAPGDAAGPQEEDERYRVRRVKLIMTYPGLEEERDVKLELTAFLPPVVEEEEGSLLDR